MIKLLKSLLKEGKRGICVEQNMEVWGTLWHGGQDQSLFLRRKAGNFKLNDRGSFWAEDETRNYVCGLVYEGLEHFSVKGPLGKGPRLYGRRSKQWVRIHQYEITDDDYTPLVLPST